MLIRFIVSNFLSFDQEQEFSMIAASLKTHKDHVYPLSGLKVLKSAAIYGANGAGKSNLIKAIEFFSELIEAGLLTRSINDKKFKLSPKNRDLPVTFEIEYFFKKQTYTYGIALNNQAVTEEWLYQTGYQKEAKMIFERKLKEDKIHITVADKYLKTKKDKYRIELMEESFLKHNELLVGKYDNLNIPEIMTLHEWNRNLSIIFPGSKFMSLVHSLVVSPKFKIFSNDLLQSFDTGVKELDTQIVDAEKFLIQADDEVKSEIDTLTEETSILLNGPDGPMMISKKDGAPLVQKAILRHNGSDGKPVDFNLGEESDGTQRLLDFIPAFNKILKGESVIIVDEIDQSLHPVLLKALITKIMKDKTTKGQFIFTTHESNLLDLEIFRQDEIWFIEKERNTGSSKAYSLMDFKPRYDLDIQKGYLKGRFGGIPFLANLQDLNWSECDV